MKRKLIFSLAVCIALFFTSFAGMSSAYEWDVCGRPLTVMGYIQQEIHYGLVQGKYDTQSGLNSFLTTALLEIGYKPTDNLKLFASGYFEGDWAYEILGNGRNNQWDAKGFGGSRHHQYIRDDWNDWLHEAHITYTTDNVFFRIGKQIVQWGETDVWRLTNLINPIDQRRGVSDVKFETSIIPIWMVRAEYNSKVESKFLSEFGVQFILDPAFKFRGNEIVYPGNDWQGVFSPNITIPGLGYVGSQYNDEEKPNDFDTEYFSYGLKLRGVLSDGTILQLLGFYGRDRDYVNRPLGAVVDFGEPMYSGNNFDHKFILHPVNSSHYYFYKFVGFTMAHEFQKLTVSALGGVAPILRFESMYAFNSVHEALSGVGGTGLGYTLKTDELSMAASIDWKVKIDWLNRAAYITISPQYFFQREMDWPHNGLALQDKLTQDTPMYQNNYKYSLLLMTSYFHNKLTPMVVWAHNQTQKDNMFLAKLSWQQNEHWTYGLSGLVFDGAKADRGNGYMKNKDKIWATITYSFQ